MTHGRVGRVAALVLLAACSKGEGNASNNAAQLAAAGNAAVSQRPPGPGDLTKPLANYSGDEFYALVQSLQYSGDSVGSRRCRDLPGCAGVSPTRNTQLSVSGVVGEDSLVPANVPQFGVIVSKGRNLGGAPDAMYGMRPGTRYEYYLVVLPGQSGSPDARWQIAQLEVVGNARTLSALATGTFRGCGHPFVRGARAGFKSCADETVRPASMSTTLQGGDPPWWVGCSAGCCVVLTTFEG